MLFSSGTLRGNKNSNQFYFEILILIIFDTQKNLKNPRDLRKKNVA
jgi:hypothetical protein